MLAKLLDFLDGIYPSVNAHSPLRWEESVTPCHPFRHIPYKQLLVLVLSQYQEKVNLLTRGGRLCSVSYYLSCSCR